MDALLAIIAACQISGACPPKAIDQYQLKCQKELIECYSKKLAAQKPTGEKTIDGVTIVPFDHTSETQPYSGTWRVISPEEREWKGPLKDCILERKIQ